MKGVGKVAGAMFMAATMAIGLWSAAPAGAATQAELEAKIKMMEQTLNEMKNQLKDVQTTQVQQQKAVEVAATSKLPGWVERLTFYGDTRFRYEGTEYGNLNGKSKDGKDRFRVRLRFGVRSQISDDVELGMRMVTGADDDATSTNQTMGNYFGEYSKWGLDRAYVKWTPSFVPQKAFMFEFGKVPQPFLTTSTIWDGDVVPEGAFAKYTFNKGGNWQPFITAAYMTVNQTGTWGQNDYAPAGQIGIRGKAGAFRFRGETGYTSWGDLGDPDHIPPNLNGNPTYTNGAGETQMSNFGVWDIYARAGFKFSEKGQVDIWGQWLQNTQASGPYTDQDTGYGAGAILNYAKFGLGFQYKYVEANASPGFIADSDSGYVNRKGWVVYAQYKMWKYGLVKLSYFDTEPVEESIPGASNPSQTFFADFVFKF